uniref:Putative secreted protein n=1 Tax=Anopheles darlingi TaxID=43151 RepID=A0A2M4DCC4_ANODA
MLCGCVCALSRLWLHARADLHTGRFPALRMVPYVDPVRLLHRIRVHRTLAREDDRPPVYPDANVCTASLPHPRYDGSL